MKRLRLIALSLVFASSLGAAPAMAGDVVLAAGGANGRLKVQSLAERKFATVIRQQFDFSCGSAAIATLLTHHYGRTVSETDAFRAMWAVGDQERIRKLGFSLLEMKNYLESISLKADGYRVTLDRVAEIGVPGIALINDDGYKHFVVVKGVGPRRVLIGDPSRGIASVPRKRFEERWDGTILYVRSEVERGKSNFNSRKDWRLTPSSPLDRPLDAEPLQSVLLSQTRSSFSGFSITSPGGSQ
jgi:predicted double-glycine peptidase